MNGAADRPADRIDRVTDRSVDPRPFRVADRPAPADVAAAAWPGTAPHGTGVVVRRGATVDAELEVTVYALADRVGGRTEWSDPSPVLYVDEVVWSLMDCALALAHVTKGLRYERAGTYYERVVDRPPVRRPA